jgi:dienelactone hydrolase
MLVALGLWPMPPRTPLKPVIHGKIDRSNYTVEKVFFASLPGHYVSGNLYRPKGRKGHLAGVLCPHGHWPGGRFVEYSLEYARAQIARKAEKTVEGARYFLQARCAQLARMGCVVFHYDMVGYADSTALPHASFNDAQAELHLQSLMGLQTWNSIRALDFLLSLPEVDHKRIGVTGASGGGTQTFILGGIDDRPTVAFPAVMVSTQFQGGDGCENASLLRLGTGNVEFAALFAPRPLGMTGAHDWTIDIERKGLPELKKVYKLYGVEQNVMARCFPQFDHNYNQVSREVMYNWFNKHLHLGQQSPVVEKKFRPVPPRELSVYDARHPRPKDTVGAQRLRQHLTETSNAQLNALQAKLPQSSSVLATALRVMLVSWRQPGKADVMATRVGKPSTHAGVTWQHFLLSRTGKGEQIPAVSVQGAKPDGTVVVWIHPEGKTSLVKHGQLIPAARKILDRNASILAVDVFGTGELRQGRQPPVKDYAGFTYGYNRTLLAQRVRDILTAVAVARGQEKTKTVHLVGFDKAGPWTLLARALAGSKVSRTAADVHRFRFEAVRSVSDEMMLPGALKYGGLPTLAALAAPGELFVHNERGTGVGRQLKLVYKAAGAADKLRTLAEAVAPEKVVDWLLR